MLASDTFSVHIFFSVGQLQIFLKKNEGSSKIQSLCICYCSLIICFHTRGVGIVEEVRMKFEGLNGGFLKREKKYV